MKLIHLSDLHLGKRVNEFPMIEDQDYILKKILGVIDEEKPDAVLIAGDVYDRSLPSEEAMKVFDDFLVSLSERTNREGQQLQVFVVSGNHDSAGRIAFGNRLMEGSGIHLASVFGGKAEKYCLKCAADDASRVTDDASSAADDADSVNIYMLPFIKPVHVKALMRDAGESEEAIAGIESYTDAVEKVLADSDIDPEACNVLISHQYVTGAERSDSEENIGGLDNVDAKAFAGFDYVALGHLHRPQNVAGANAEGKTLAIRYCGSPLKYSFSELRDQKSVTIVELQTEGTRACVELQPKGTCACGQEDGDEEGSKTCEIRTVPLKPLHEMYEIRGKFDDLMQKSFYEGTDYEEAYLRVILTDEDRVPEAIGRMRNVYHNVMTLEYENLAVDAEEMSGGINVEEKTPMEIFREFYMKAQGREMTDEQEELIGKLVENIWEDER